MIPRGAPVPIAARGRRGSPMVRRLRALFRDLSGASSEAFRSNLLGALDATLDGALLVRRLIDGQVSASEARDEMRVIEHRGDAERARLVLDLRSALVTPIDREDLFRLSRAIDDVLDNLRDFVREWLLFELDRSSVAAPLAEVVAVGIVDLRGAVEALVADPRAITSRALAAKKTTNAIRRIFDAQMAALFVGQVDVVMLRERELLRRLDVVGLRLGEAADALSEAAVKRAEA